VASSFQARPAFLNRTQRERKSRNASAAGSFHEHPEQPDGIIYPSRLNAETNLAVYGRAISKLSVHGVTPLIHAKGLADSSDELKVALVA
jgi:hypothetical protein